MKTYIKKSKATFEDQREEIDSWFCSSQQFKTSEELLQHNNIKNKTMKNEEKIKL
jgi:hypothetical protein